MRSTDPKTKLGELFRDRRTALRLTMREVAGTLLSPTAVNNIEKGKINPTIETVLYLCRVLKLSPETALIHYPDFAKSAPVLLEIVDRYLAEHRLDTSITLLYDMVWVVSEQELHGLWYAEIQLRLALAFARLERYECARLTITQAYSGFLEHKNIEQKLLALYYLGSIELADRNVNAAIAIYRQALSVVRRYQYCHRCVGDILYSLAQAYLLQLDPDNALRASHGAELAYRKSNAPDATAHTLLQQAAIHLRQSHMDEAERLALQAQHYFATCDPDDVSSRADQVYKRQDLHPALSARGHAARLLGDVYAALERWDEARAHYAESIQFIGLSNRAERFAIERGLAEVALCVQDIASARRNIQTALLMCNEGAGAPQSCTTQLDSSNTVQDHEGMEGLQARRSEEPSRTREELLAQQRALAYRMLARCEQQTGNRAGYVQAMQEACAILLGAGDPLQAALLQTELAEETADWELMRTATQTLRRLHERLL
ncbi:helix-turn-helix domain-containing protein [Tumebacillus permanentifrigoris]|uniref:DNA-binding XRE family transcriptional regulator n=1 Tax=Tumebacillus permanentifrigoris TaxID=378543 RepID=A0A316D4K5_9BACL|nr:helix-turn-helix domain-containing protein [Tumebacillus permanentifrigoris]PWK05417.1 DNA-binding XRE family transcriptional regulator [Tumebacillus permanentifrigoris]